jgi:hypothetical protein
VAGNETFASSETLKYPRLPSLEHPLTSLLITDTSSDGARTTRVDSVSSIGSWRKIPIPLIDPPGREPIDQYPVTVDSKDCLQIKNRPTLSTVCGKGAGHANSTPLKPEASAPNTAGGSFGIFGTPLGILRISADRATGRLPRGGYKILSAIFVLDICSGRAQSAAVFRDTSQSLSPRNPILPEQALPVSRRVRRIRSLPNYRGRRGDRCGLSQN